jgi:hypothetical protein
MHPDTINELARQRREEDVRAAVHDGLVREAKGLPPPGVASASTFHALLGRLLRARPRPFPVRPRTNRDHAPGRSGLPGSPIGSPSAAKEG